MTGGSPMRKSSLSGVFGGGAGELAVRGEPADAACHGQEIEVKNGPHPGQPADDGGVRLLGVIAGNAYPLLGGGGHSLVHQRLYPFGGQPTGAGQVFCQPFASGAADLGRGDVTDQQRQVGLEGEIHRSFEARMDGIQVVSRPVDAPGLLHHQIVPVTGQQPHLYVEFGVRFDQAQIAAQPHLIGSQRKAARQAAMPPNHPRQPA